MSIVPACLCLATNCGWQKQVDFQGPSGAVLSLRQPWPANGWGLQVRLCERGACDVIYTFRGDTFLRFADAYWSSDGRTVAVLTCGEPYLRLAYDRVHRRTIPFAPYADALRERIRADYQRFGNSNSLSQDPLTWACTENAGSVFGALHPAFAQR